jgi:hypothetical protein
MRARLPILTVLCATALAAAGLLAAPAVAKPPAQTSFDLIHIDGAGTTFHNYEYRWTCEVYPPFDCYTYGGHVVVQIIVNNRPTKPLAPVTVSYAIDDITAVQGVNHSGPTTGTLTIPDTPPGHNDVLLSIPIIDTGSVGAPDKTLRVRLTGSSVPGANISDTAIGIIHSEGQIPRDCIPSRPDGQSFSTTCTGRPAGSQWRVSVTCLEGFRGVTRYGPTITGNGTSAATCTGSSFDFYYWDFHLIS